MTEWTLEERRYGELHLDEGKALVESGDLDIEVLKIRFSQINERNTTLTDDQIIMLSMSQDDDYGEDWIIERIPSAEVYYANLAAEQSKAAK